MREQALRAVVVAHDDLVLLFGLHGLLDLISTETATERAEHGRQILAASGSDLVSEDAANHGAAVSKNVASIKMLPNAKLDPVFAAVVQATEEAITNAMIAADSMTGIDGHHVTALDHEKLRATLKKYNRLM